jgi:hypothetical protein
VAVSGVTSSMGAFIILPAASPAAQVLLAACGATAGAGLALLWRSLRLTRPDVVADLRAFFADPAPPSADRRRLDEAGRRLADAATRHGLSRLLLVDDLVLAGRTVDAHTTLRLTSMLIGAAGGVVAWIAASLVAPSSPVLAPVFMLFGGLSAISLADRPIRALALRRRREARLAVAAYVDLLRILLVGGLPLQAALPAAADQGRGWAFGQIQAALRWARDRGAPPEDGLRRLAASCPVPEFGDLAASIAAARRGASPVQALESKAAFMRGAHDAEVRAEAAVADAQIELPAAAVAMAFVCFLTYPFLTLINSSTGVVP